jgi:hypothetical protein
MFHPAARRRRMKKRQMVQAVKNAGGQGNQQAQQENVSGLQGWTWWQQLIGVEVLVGFIAILWYYCVQVYYEAKFKQLSIPLDYIDYSFNSLIVPGKYMFQYIMIAILSIINGSNFKTSPINILMPLSLCFTITFTSHSPNELNPFGLFITLMSTFGIAIASFGNAKIWFNVESMLIKLENIHPKTFLYRVYIKSGIISLVLFIPVALMYSGIKDATTSKFYVIKQNEQVKVIFDMYKDYYITAPVDLKKKTFKTEFELIPMHKDDKDPPVIVVKDTKELNQAEKQEEKIVLKYMEIGPLKPENPSEP